MLRLVMITYNDMPTVERTVSSAYDFVDEIIAVDGRFCDFPGEKSYSTDGTIDFLQSVDKVTLIVASDFDEVAKRNLYLIGDEGDWYLHLDADEELALDRKAIDQFAQTNADTDAYIISLRRVKPKYDMDRVRLFRHIPGLHYNRKHYWLHDKYRETFALLEKVGKKYRGRRLDNAKILHHEDERSPERVSAKRRYYNKALSPRERPIKETL